MLQIVLFMCLYFNSAYLPYTSSYKYVFVNIIKRKKEKIKSVWLCLVYFFPWSVITAERKDVMFGIMGVEMI